MADQNEPINVDEVAEFMAAALPKSKCTATCHQQYMEALKKCKGDRDCIERATGQYVLCVFRCRGKP